MKYNHRKRLIITTNRETQLLLNTRKLLFEMLRCSGCKKQEDFSRIPAFVDFVGTVQNTESDRDYPEWGKCESFFVSLLAIYKIEKNIALDLFCYCIAINALET